MKEAKGSNLIFNACAVDVLKRKASRTCASATVLTMARKREKPRARGKEVYQHVQK